MCKLGFKLCQKSRVRKVGSQNVPTQMVTVKYHEVKALFCKMFRHVENWAQNALSVGLHTKCLHQVTVLGTDPVFIKEIDMAHFTTLYLMAVS